MKRYALSLLIPLAFVNSVCADTPSAPIKLCVYSADDVMMKSKEWEEINKGLAQKTQGQALAIQKKEEALRDEANKLNANKSMMSEAAFEREQTAWMRKRRALETEAMELQQIAKEDQQAAAMAFVKELEKSIGEFAKENGFDLVTPKGMGFYVSAKADQTDKLVSFVNQKYQGKASKLSSPRKS